MLCAGILQAQDKHDQAFEALAEARAVAESCGARWRLWQIYFALAESETRRGNLAEAESLRAQAREIVEYIAARTPPDLCAVFLKLPGVQALLQN